MRIWTAVSVPGFALATLLFLAGAANADSITFKMTGTLSPFEMTGSTAHFSGTFVLNTSTGVVTSWNILMPAVSGIPSFDFKPSDSTFAYLSTSLHCGSGIGGMQFQAPGLLAFFILPQASLVGFKGASIIPNVDCGTFTELSAYAIIPLDFSTVATVNQGSITPTTTVPEPASALLILTGVVGLRLKRRNRA